MILLCHIDDLMVAGVGSDIVKLSAHLNVSSKINISWKFTHSSGCTSSGALRKGNCADTLKVVCREDGGNVRSREDA